MILETENNPHPSIEAICIVGKPLEGWDEDPNNKKDDLNAMLAKNTRVVTYQQLIQDSYNSYKAYLETNKEKGFILDIIHRIEEEEFS